MTRTYLLPDGRRLHVAPWEGLLVFTVHDEDGACRSGPLVLDVADVPALRRALDDIAGGRRLTSDERRARVVALVATAQTRAARRR